MAWNISCIFKRPSRPWRHEFANMRPSALFILLVFLTLSAVADDSYTTRFDGIDVEAVLKNERILRRYVECALDKGPCTAEGRELKKRIPDALRSDCVKCSSVQRKQARRVLEFLMKHKRSYWDQLVKKYDPDGAYRRRNGIGNKS